MGELFGQQAKALKFLKKKRKGKQKEKNHRDAQVYGAEMH